MTTYEQRILGKQRKSESWNESVSTGVLMLLAFVLLVGIIYMLPHAL